MEEILNKKGRGGGGGNPGGTKARPAEPGSH